MCTPPESERRCRAMCQLDMRTKLEVEGFRTLMGPHQAESRLQDWKALVLIGVITGESHCLNLEGSYC